MKISHSISKENLGPVIEAVIENSFDSIMVTATDDESGSTPIVFVNEAFTALTGYTVDEVLGKSPSLLQGPDTDPVIIERLRKDLEDGRVFQGSTINYRKDGVPFTMDWRVAPVVRADGGPKYHIAVQRNDG